MRPVPAEPVPFSTPRAWTLFSRALDMAEASGILTNETRRALAFGRLSAEDAVVFCALAEEAIGPMRPLEEYIEAAGAAAASGLGALVHPQLHPPVRARRQGRPIQAAHINRFLRSLSSEHQLTVLTDLVEQWGALGADRAMFDLLKKVTAT